MMYRERTGKEVLVTQAAAVPMPMVSVHEVPPMMEEPTMMKEAEVMGKPPIIRPLQWLPAVEEPKIMEVPSSITIYHHLSMALACLFGSQTSTAIGWPDVAPRNFSLLIYVGHYEVKIPCLKLHQNRSSY
jgi:hypothetical protein